MLAIALLVGVVVHAQPTLTGFTPGSGPVGTLVTLTGTNLSNPTNIEIGGVAAIPISNNGNTLVAMVMPGATTGPISVTTAGGSANAANQFTVTPTRAPNVQLGNKIEETGPPANSDQANNIALSADGNTAIIGGFNQNNNSGAAWIFVKNGSTWNLEQELVATGAVGYSQMGSSVAISADGNTAVTGGPFDNSEQGAAWIFIRHGNTWTQQGSKLVGTGGSVNARQGYCVSMSADGNTVLSGGIEDANQTGAVWIFTRSGNDWTQQGSRLVGIEVDPGSARAGFSAALSADGNTAIVGRVDINSKGEVRVFIRSAGVWSQQQKLAISGALGNAREGNSVALSADGNTALIGGPKDQGLKGAVWVFTRTGSSWTQQTKLVATGAVGNAQLGINVALSADGNTAICGGSNDNNLKGATWIFTRNGSTWTQQGNKLVGSNAGDYIKQGTALAMSADGNFAVVAGFIDNGPGAAWLFTHMPPPIISAFSPTVAAAGTVIAISGTNLSETSEITLGGTPVSSFTVVSSHLIMAVVGSGSTGALSLVTPGGTASLAGFSFIPPPTITDFYPTTAAAGTQMSITGTNLTGTSIVTLGGTPVAAFTVVSSTTLLAVVGNGSSGAIGITTPGGSASMAGFNFIPPPTIISFSPTAVGSGATITITGTNFIGTFAITLGGTSVQVFTVVSSTAIVAVVGAGASGEISLTTPGGTASITGFIFVPQPFISSFSSTSGPVGTLVTINGSNLNYLLSVVIAGVGAIPIRNDGNTLVAMVMPGATVGGISVVTVGGAAAGTGNFSVTSSQPPNAQQGGKLVGTGAIGKAQQGTGVAISADGNTAIVGGFLDNGNRGAAWIFNRNGNSWIQQSKLVGSGSLGTPVQGFSVDISADGNTVIIGGYGDNYGVGAAWIFTRSGISWTQQGSKLVGSNWIWPSFQGYSVALSADGNTAMIGGHRDDNFKGAAWIFIRSGNAWLQQGTKLVGTGASEMAQMGYSVALSADGNTAVMGGPTDDNNKGASWVLTRNGGEWTFQGSKLVGTGTEGNAQMGYSVALSADGNTAIIGGPADNSDKGASWIFTRAGGIWSQQGNKLVSQDAVGNAYQGNAVSISADGNTAIIAGYRDDTFKGASFIFKRNGNTWSMQGKKLVASGAQGNANLGWSLDLSADGNIAIVGGWTDDSNVGAAWLFTYFPPPIITSFTPSAAPIGTTIAITGANFSGTSEITLGGNPVAAFTVVSSSTIVAVVGSGSSGALSIVTPYGTATKDGFIFIPAPIISSFTPTAAAFGDQITITGSNFDNTSSITLGGTSVSSFTVVSSTIIVAIVGSGSSGAISLVTPGGSATAEGFSFIPAPVIISFTPTTAAKGAIMTITGNNFSGTSAVTLGGTSVSSFTVVSSTSIVAIVGKGSTGALSLISPGGIATQSGFTYIPAPIITGFIPSSQGTGKTMTITGSNFDNTSSITLGGTSVSSFTVVSSNTIVAIVGSGSSGAISLVTLGGSATAEGFLHIPAPNISLFYPTAAGTGTLITITGSNFDNTSSISLGSTSASSFTVVSANTVVAMVGNGANGEISLTTPGGTATRNGFTFIPPPTIVSFVPANAALGTLITINGTNLNGTTSVTLGGMQVTVFTVVSTSTIEAIVGNVSSGAVSLTTPGGTATRNGFTFIPPPSISSFLPNTAASGAIITITGNNLNGTTSLSLGGTPVSAFTVVSSTSIVASVSTGSTGDVSLTSPGGTATRSGFTYIPPPTIVSFAPANAALGTLITINGTNLNGTTSVTLGGMQVTVFTVVSTSTIEAIVGNVSSGAVSLTTPGGTATRSGFTFIPPPFITSFLPNTAASGAIITITGKNLNGTTSLSLGGTPVSAFTVVSSTSIVASVSTGSTGDVSLTSPGGTATRNGFTFIPPPTITSFAPTTAASGTIITINGNNLNGTSQLSLGGTNVSAFTVVSSNLILALVGGGSSGAVSLSTPGGTTSLNGFAFIPPPVITSFAPASAASGTIINITGNHLSEASAISLGGTPVASFTVVSSTFILAEVGSGSSGSLAITTPGGTAAMNGFVFISPPILNDFSPKLAGKGAIITITGAILNEISSIKLGGSFVASYKRISSSTVLAVVGSGSSGSLELVTSGGRATLSGFRFIPAPIINSFTPTSAAAGTLMTVTGAHLTGTSEVSLGGVPVASFQVLSSTTLIIVVGSGASGSLYLATPGGSGSLGGFKFLLYPPNTIPVFSNAFSPNGDGINDYWRLDFLRDYPNATIQVMNRLGQVVFSAVGYNQPWDGRYKGELLPVGTYYYIINLKNGMPPIIGSITIIR